MELMESRVVKWHISPKSLSLEWWREHEINNRVMANRYANRLIAHSHLPAFANRVVSCGIVSCGCNYKSRSVLDNKLTVQTTDFSVFITDQSKFDKLTNSNNINCNSTRNVCNI